MTSFFLALLIACGGGSTGSDKEICGDGFDNDGNGLSDCADPACLGVEFDMDGDGEPDPCPEFCGDGVDNDNDGLVDCDDPSCDGTGCPEVCDDQRDNDKDDAWDCDDKDCQDECDRDGDGFFNVDMGGDDCDDDNPDANPMALEVCDGADNDCDGLVDLDDDSLETDTLTTWYEDADGDGYGSAFTAVDDCFAPANYIDVDGDCDDTNAFLNPSQLELCDGLDNDCDGLFDGDDPSVDLSSATTWYPDLDGDGFGVNISPVDSCTPPPNHASNNTDCDDTNPQITDAGDWIQDIDGDGYGSGASVGPTGCTPPGPDYVSDNTPIDCDDADPYTNPGATDPCGDGIDWNCDGVDCVTFWDGFEGPTISTDWTNSGNATWFTQNVEYYGGAQAAECGNISDNQVSTLTIIRDFPAGGDVEFWHMGDTEGGWDFLEFWVDGVMVQEWSGNWSWTQEVHPVTPGQHTIVFEYDKDGSVSAGQDTVWIDEVVLNGAI